MEVTEVTHGISTVLQPHEKGKFDVVVTNNGSVRLTNLIYELSISPDDVAKLVSPGGMLIVVRKRLDPDSDVIPNGDEATKMFVTPNGAITYASVDPGESVTFPELQVSTKNTLGHRHDQVLDLCDRRPGELVPRRRGELGGEADADGQLTDRPRLAADARTLRCEALRSRRRR